MGASRDIGKFLGVRLIEQQLKTAEAHPVDSWRAQAQYEVARRKLMQEMSVPDETIPFQEALAGNNDFYKRFRGIYDQYFGPLMGAGEAKPATAAERAPKVVSVAK